MKILVVGQDFPWPSTYGSSLRLGQVIQVASSLGETDFFSFYSSLRPDPCEVPRTVALRRVETVLHLPPNYSARRRALWFVSPGMPLEVSAARSPHFGARLAEWSDPPYDLVWFSRASTFALLGRPDLGPTIVDLDDLEDRKIQARIALMGAKSKGQGLHNVGAKLQARVNCSKWRTLQRTVASSVERVVLCSDLDASRFCAGNVTVIPNGYDAPTEPVGRLEVGDPPTILLQGSLTYGPNADAARWLVETIAPRIRERLPSVQIRLVGEPDNSLIRLDHPPQVTVVGRVPSMEPELARADLVVVPIRYGSGTRVKILEAFAHRIPVVSTTLGAEGLGLEPGRHLLVEDDADSFAAACAHLLGDKTLRQGLTDEANRLFLDRYQWTAAREKIKELMLASGRTSSH